VDHFGLRSILLEENMVTKLQLDDEIKELLNKFEICYQENRALSLINRSNEQKLVESMAKRTRELGPTGIIDLRRALLPASESDTMDAEAAARTLAILEDGPSLVLVMYQAAKFWDSGLKKRPRESGGTLATFLEAARALMPDALKSGPFHESVIETLNIFVRNVSEGRDYYDVFETAACTGSPQCRDELIKIFLDQFWGDTRRRSCALYALRHYPEMQATMLEAINHPEEEVSSKAADAMVEMLGIPGCGKTMYYSWQEWAMEHVPPELKLKPPSRMDVLLKRKPRMDRRQALFWKAFDLAYEKATRGF
jgi:hypothetical protein